MSQNRRPFHPTTSLERTGITAYREEVTVTGVTLREQFAAMAMQGLLAGNYSALAGNADSPVPSALAQEAVAHADALIAELNKPVKP
jgi:hypothetical protein